MTNISSAHRWRAIRKDPKAPTTLDLLVWFMTSEVDGSQPCMPGDASSRIGGGRWSGCQARRYF